MTNSHTIVASFEIAAAHPDALEAFPDSTHTGTAQKQARLVPVQALVPCIMTAQDCLPAIDYHHLAVVATVGSTKTKQKVAPAAHGLPQRGQRPGDRMVNTHRERELAQVLQLLRQPLSTAKAVHQQPDFNTLSRAPFQLLQQSSPVLYIG